MGSRSIDSDGECGAVHGDDVLRGVDGEAHVEAPIQALRRPCERRDKGFIQRRSRGNLRALEREGPHRRADERGDVDAALRRRPRGGSGP